LLVPPSLIPFPPQPKRMECNKQLSHEKEWKVLEGGSARGVGLMMRFAVGGVTAGTGVEVEGLAGQGRISGHTAVVLMLMLGAVPCSAVTAWGECMEGKKVLVEGRAGSLVLTSGLGARLGLDWDGMGVWGLGSKGNCAAAAVLELLLLV